MTRSTCPYCGVGCGVILTPRAGGGLTVTGDPDHPANFGRLCSKGSALGETLDMPGRLTTPLIAGQPASWDVALGVVAARFTETIARHGPDSVAFYLSGQMLTEDYYVANKLMKGFIGSANVDTNSRLCMASTVVGHVRAFGSDTVPGTYEDLEEADLIVLVGSNLAWCHPVLWQRIEAARARRKITLVVVDPRRTPTADGADLHLAVAGGGDVALFNHLLCAIADRGLIDADFSPHVTGIDAALAAAREGGDTGLDPVDLASFVALWCGTKKVVTVFSQGVNQSVQGSDKVNAILNCHLATGRIGRPGMGPFSVTGQPNAMGGREVGGLANQLACHLSLEDASHRAAVQDFWGSPQMPQRAGLKAVDMFRAVGSGAVKALWIIHTNPAATMPDADAVRAAIAGCDFVVVSDVTGQTDTARLAHVLLPAAAWAEKSGTVTNSDRTISRQRAALAPPGQAMPDWWALAKVGARMGWPDAFDWQGPAAIFREHAALSGVAGRLGRDFDISGHAKISDVAYDALAPFRWPHAAGRQGGRFFGDGRFFTPDGRGRMVPVRPRAAAAALDAGQPFRLNTGRVRDQWHSMTRTSLAPRLNLHRGEPFVELHPTDADRLGLLPSGLAALTSPTGTAILRVLVTDRVRPGEGFAPMHWTGEHAPTGRICALIPALVDPLSGQPELKAAAVALAPWPARWFAFVASERRFQPATGYSAVMPGETGWRGEVADLVPPSDIEAFARALFNLPDAAAAMVVDRARGLVRLALMAEGRIAALLFAGPAPVALSRDAAARRIGTRPGPDMLSPWLGSAAPDPGPVLCACNGVGRNTIAAAVASGCCDLATLGKVTGAGMVCGGCRPELLALIAAQPSRLAAE